MRRVMKAKITSTPNSSVGTNKTSTPKTSLDDDLKNNSLTMTRTRRTPKPNPKYMNDEIVRPSKNSPHSSSSELEDDDDDDEDMDEKFMSKIKKNEKSADIEIRGRNLFTKKVPAPPIIAKPTVSLKPAFNIKPSTNTSATNNIPPRKSYEMRDLTQKKDESLRLISNSKRTQPSMAMPNFSNKVNVVIKRVNPNEITKKIEPVIDLSSKKVLRKRPAKNDDIDFEVPSNEDDDEDISEEEIISPRTRRSKQMMAKIDLESNNNNKINSLIRTKLTPIPTIGQTRSTATLQQASQQHQNNNIKKDVNVQPQSTKIVSPKLNESNLNTNKNVPTFTIVNINDIIKKGPEPPMKKRKVDPVKELNEDDELDSIDDDDDVELVEINASMKNKNDSDSSYTTNNIKNSNNNSRRKTQHTTILTDDFETKIKSTQVNKTSGVVKTLVNSYNSGKLKENKTNAIKSEEKPASSTTQSKIASRTESTVKEAPRILNTMLARNKKLQNDLITELNMPSLSGTTANINNKSKSNLLKENLKLYKPSGNLSSINSNTSSNVVNKSKLESLMETKPKIVYEQQDGQRVKKITCFETWYVINIPNVEIPIQRPYVSLNLIRLGNQIKSIELPSSDWTYRITLSKLKKENSKTEDVYTGEIQDDHIPESERHNYEPINIMFRRTNQNLNLLMQFDRAIIFKNRSYFLNIDGKGVKLIGAPQYINSIKEIETLIQIVDDISLVNSYVEQTHYVL